MLKRYNLHINGIVQGVGFRPFVYNLASKLNLSGWVKNTGNGVEIEIQGDLCVVQDFLFDLKKNNPPLSEILSIDCTEIPTNQEDQFHIIDSTESQQKNTMTPPDMSICPDCLKELFDPDNPRYLYPFINCTHCGPRYTIIKNIPYDRINTSMSAFELCSHCQSEYSTPDNRRFHAEAIACPQCGPHLYFEDNHLSIHDNRQAIQETVSRLIKSEIVAIKGIGGFHLAVDAMNPQAVDKLRERKQRKDKPFALMVPDLGTAKKIAHINYFERDLLLSQERPIVLLKKKDEMAFDRIAPSLHHLGIMLPYSPLHYLIFHELKQQGHQGILVMTSGNLSDEPICIDNNEAKERLNNIADCFLLNNREILIPVDDSVVFTAKKDIQLIRRSRGYVPKPIILKKKGPPVLATGGELKNTICLLKDNYGFLSQHIGDLESIETYDSFKKSLIQIQSVYGCQAELLAHDFHPNYLSTKYAQEQKEIPTLAVQHHHAHMASVMAENQLEQPVIGLILDGTGYGLDNTIWGGEILIGDFLDFKRFGHIQQFHLPGGEQSIQNIERIGLSLLYSTYGEMVPDIPFLEPDNHNLIFHMIQKKLNSPLTSSCGRLFDGIASICGIRNRVDYEAQAAIELSQYYDPDVNSFYNYDIVNENSLYILKFEQIIKEIITDTRNNASLTALSSRFHNSLVNMFSDVLVKAANEHSIDKTVLSGGVFQNEHLLKNMILNLRQKSLDVYYHRQVPSNDGGLSLGQALIARYRSFQ